MAAAGEYLVGTALDIGAELFPLHGVDGGHHLSLGVKGDLGAARVLRLEIVFAHPVPMIGELEEGNLGRVTAVRALRIGVIRLVCLVGERSHLKEHTEALLSRLRQLRYLVYGDQLVTG